MSDYPHPAGGDSPKRLPADPNVLLGEAEHFAILVSSLCMDPGHERLRGDCITCPLEFLTTGTHWAGDANQLPYSQLREIAARAAVAGHVARSAHDPETSDRVFNEFVLGRDDAPPGA